MKKIIVNKAYRTDYFEVVEKIPHGFFVWNIGDNMTSGYLPLCESANDPEYPGTINATTLKAIKMNENELEILKKVAGYGYTSKNAKKSGIKYAVKYCGEETVKLATKIFDRISE